MSLNPSVNTIFQFQQLFSFWREAGEGVVEERALLLQISTINLSPLSRKSCKRPGRVGATLEQGLPLLATSFVQPPQTIGCTHPPLTSDCPQPLA